jgi:RNA polymerase sigma-70 factor, ECF subfamily
MVSLDALEAEAPGAVLRDEASTHDLVEARDLQERVRAAVMALPDDQREVIVLKEYEGLTFQEIAEVLDLPVSTVKTRLYRGLERMRERLVSQGVNAPAVSAVGAR